MQLNHLIKFIILKNRLLLKKQRIMTRKPTEVRREEIKLAVLKIIRAEGIKAVSTKNLAKYTGLSEGAIFRHFKSKKDIIISIIDDVKNSMIENLREIAYDDTKADKRLYKFLCSNINYLMEHNGITILLFTEASHADDYEMMAKLNLIFDSQRELVGKIINDGISEGIWNKNISIDSVTQLYMGIPITYNINLILSNKKSHNQDFCKEMMNLFERILLV